MNRSLTLLVYGASKSGKSSLAVTAPEPRLLINTEATAHKFLPVKLKKWKPLEGPPPQPDGTWDTCVIIVNSYAEFMKAMEYLRTGQHQFRSVLLDSITELQNLLQNKIAGNATEALQLQQWGDMQRHLNAAMRDLRDLAEHETNPLEAVVITAAAKKDPKTGKFTPHLQGQSATLLPYLYDITGALAIESRPNPDPSQPAVRGRVLYIEDTPQYYAGERVQGRLGTVIQQEHLNIGMWLDHIFGPRSETPTE
jgi:hypothetical protein